MNESYVTLTELLTLLAVFVGPFVVVGAIVQHSILVRANVRGPRNWTFVVCAALLTVALTWGLVFVLPIIIPFVNVFNYGAPFILPAIIASLAVTLAVRWYAKARIRRQAA